MNPNRGNIVLRCIVVFLEIIFSYPLQNSVFPYFEMANVVPDVLLILIVSTAFFKGQNAGVLTGFFAGLLMDFCIGNYLGIFAILYMVIGYFNGYAAKIFDREDYLLPLGLIAVSELVYGFLYYVFFALLNGRLTIGYFFGRVILPRVIYTTFAAVLLYKFFQGIHLLLLRFEYRGKR